VKNKTKKEVKAQVIDYSTVNPEIIKSVNFKSATIRYSVSGKIYENKIQVPMRYMVGDEITIKYDVDNPSEISSKNIIVI